MHFEMDNLNKFNYRKMTISNDTFHRAIYPSKNFIIQLSHDC